MQFRNGACELTWTATVVIPYQEPVAKGDNVEFQSTLSSTLPMAAIFMRNKYIGWYAQTRSHADATIPLSAASPTRACIWQRIASHPPSATGPCYDTLTH